MSTHSAFRITASVTAPSGHHLKIPLFSVSAYSVDHAAAVARVVLEAANPGSRVHVEAFREVPTGFEAATSETPVT